MIKFFLTTSLIFLLGFLNCNNALAVIDFEPQVVNVPTDFNANCFPVWGYQFYNGTTPVPLVEVNTFNNSIGVWNGRPQTDSTGNTVYNNTGYYITVFGFVVPQSQVEINQVYSPYGATNLLYTIFLTQGTWNDDIVSQWFKNVFKPLTTNHSISFTPIGPKSQLLTTMVIWEADLLDRTQQAICNNNGNTNRFILGQRAKIYDNSWYCNADGTKNHGFAIEVHAKSIFFWQRVKYIVPNKTLDCSKA